MKKESVVMNKSYAFALRVVKLYKYITIEKRSMFFQNNYYVVELL